MQEIEIKARLRDEAVVVEKLTALGCTLSAPVAQDDTVYVERPGDLATFLANPVFLRIRVQDDGKVLFTAKQRRELALVATEHEVTVDSRDELARMLAMMGYHEAVRVLKTRRTAHYDGCELCLDLVEGLGAFIEMEKLSKDGDAAAIQEELWTFFEGLGIAPEDRVTKGYDILMLESRA